MSDDRRTTFETGELCAKFRIVELLGKGGMGEVYLAVDTFLGRRVALKVLPFKRSVDPTFQDRMQREAMAGARIDHPNVTKILDGGATAQNVFYVVMELLEGMRTLRALCHKVVLPFDSGIVIAIQVAEGLSAIHAAGIVHRDMKPENVAVLPGGIVKIIDFGLAKVRGEWIRTSVDPVRGAQRMGTAQYMSPEQFDNRTKDIGACSDVYALGCILFEIFSGGRHVFQGDGEHLPDAAAAMFGHGLKKPPRLDDIELDEQRRIPRALADIIDRCLEKDVHARPGADEVARELRKILGEIKVSPISSAAQTTRTAVPTDALLSRAGSMPGIMLPPESLSPDKKPGAPAVVTPAAWELHGSPPRGFAPVLSTELLPEKARPTLASPKPVAEPRHGNPPRTVRMNVASAAPPDPALRRKQPAPAAGSPSAPEAPRPVPTQIDGKPRVTDAAPSIATEVDPIRFGRTSSPGSWLWYHRISIAPGFLLPFAVWAIFFTVRALSGRGDASVHTVSGRPEGSALPAVPSAPVVTSTPSLPDLLPSSTAAPSAGASAVAPKWVSPAGTARSWPAGARPGQSPASPPTKFNPHGL